MRLVCQDDVGAACPFRVPQPKSFFFQNDATKTFVYDLQMSLVLVTRSCCDMRVLVEHKLHPQECAEACILLTVHAQHAQDVLPAASWADRERPIAISSC